MAIAMIWGFFNCKKPQQWGVAGAQAACTAVKCKTLNINC